MTSVEAKQTADELACRVFEFLNEAEPNPAERDKRYIELATSFLMATINVNRSKEEIIEDVLDKLEKMGGMIADGVDRYLSGDMSRIRSEHTDKQ